MKEDKWLIVKAFFWMLLGFLVLGIVLLIIAYLTLPYELPMPDS